MAKQKNKLKKKRVLAKKRGLPRPKSVKGRVKQGIASKRVAGKSRKKQKIIVNVPPEMRMLVGKVVALIGPNKIFRKPALREFREKLLQLRQRITGQIDFLAADNLKRVKDDNEVSFRSEEQGTDNFDRDFALNRVSSEQDVIFEIDESLNRIQVGTYGMCEQCSGSVEKARLGALPYSRLCLACQRKSERGKQKYRAFDSAVVFPNADKAGHDSSSEEE